MAHGKSRDPHKEHQWRCWIQLWQRSGLTIRAFCARHHLREPNFYAWRRQLQQRDAATPPFLLLQIVPEPQAQATTAIEVVLTGGRCLRVTAGFDPVTLRQLVATLEETSSC